MRSYLLNPETAMNEPSHLKEVGLTGLVVRAKTRTRVIIYFVVCFAGLGAISYIKPQPYRAAYAGLDCPFATSIVLVRKSAPF